MAGKKKTQEQVSEEKQMSIEESFRKLQEILEKMEEEDITLEQSFACYEEGMKLVRSCNEKIEEVEHKVMQLNEDGSLDEF
ncbi:MAG: exodeoxyribonuclease VII small subunit [bacterium]